jgi:hypothetical protein
VIWDNVRANKIFSSRVRTPRFALPVEQQEVAPIVNVVYPNDVSLLGEAIVGKAESPKKTACSEGDTVYVKINVPRSTFQRGRCALFVSLASQGIEFARSQSVQLDVDDQPE